MMQHRVLRVIGGDPAKAHAVIEGKTGEPAAAYGAWSESVPRYPSIADFDSQGLVPLYELATGDRREALAKAWKDYMQAHTDPALLRLRVRYGDRLYLRHQHGNYLAPNERLPRNPMAYVDAWPYSIVTNDMSEFYATLDPEGRVAIALESDDVDSPGAEVKSGQVVRIKTLEPSVGSYNLLGAWSHDNYLYYHKPGYDEEKWVLRVPGSKASYEPVRYGDKVEIVSYRTYKDQKLAKGEPWRGYTLLTTSPGGDGYWTFEKA